MTGYFFRHVLAVIVLPVTVTVFVPVWLARRFPMQLAPPRTAIDWVAGGMGVVALVTGTALFLACLHRFGGEGRGTLAPWDPPRNLVTQGPYAFVRNPMISGVLLVVLAEALLLRSAPHFAWAVLFGGLNALYIPLLEEPGLRRRFGASFDEYARHVPRLVPRIRPWRSQ